MIGSGILRSVRGLRDWINTEIGFGDLKIGRGIGCNDRLGDFVIGRGIKGLGILRGEKII
jgi:hypothetical protein